MDSRRPTSPAISFNNKQPSQKRARPGSEIDDRPRAQKASTLYNQASIKVNHINQAMQMFHELTPDAETYPNEADYFMTD